MVDDKKKQDDVPEKAEDVKEEAPKTEEAKEAPAKETSEEAPKEEKKAPKKKAPAKKKAPKTEKKAEKAKKEKKEEEAPVEEKKTEDVPEPAKEEKEEKAPVEEKKTEDIPEPAEEKKEEEPPAEEKKTEDIPEPEAEEVSEEEAKEAPKREKKEKAPSPEELIFGMYNTSDVIVEDPSLKAHINLDPAYVPHSSARHANKPFYKAKISIVERLVNSIMRTQKYTGKKTKSSRAVKDAFEIIQEKTKTNPVQILVQAIENSAPREEVTRLKFGGISVPKAVDAGPSRRLDIALRNISVGSVKSSHKNRKSISVCLANELIAAANGDVQSYAVSKRDEVERVAKSAH